LPALHPQTDGRDQHQHHNCHRRNQPPCCRSTSNVTSRIETILTRLQKPPSPAAVAEGFTQSSILEFEPVTAGDVDRFATTATGKRKHSHHHHRRENRSTTMSIQRQIASGADRSPAKRALSDPAWFDRRPRFEISLSHQHATASVMAERHRPRVHLQNPALSGRRRDHPTDHPGLPAASALQRSGDAASHRPRPTGRAQHHHY